MDKDKNIFPFIRKEDGYFVIGSIKHQSNEILLSKIEIIRLKKKLNSIDINKFWWKNII